MRAWVCVSSLGVGAIFVTACQGDFTTMEEPGADGAGGTGTGGDQTGSGSDTGTGGDARPPLTECPPEPPEGSDPCEPGLECTYGDDPRLACRENYACDGTGRFQVTAADCEPLDGCLDELPHQYGGAPCTEIGRTCWYPELFPACVCTPCLEDTCPDLGTYECMAEQPGCPLVAPNVGQPCEPSDGDPNPMSCVFVPCGSPYELQMECLDGKWARVDADCPER